MSETTAKGTKKGRKYGRNSKKAAKYINENKRIKNKIIKLKKHLKKFPSDEQSELALGGLE